MITMPTPPTPIPEPTNSTLIVFGAGIALGTTISALTVFLARLYCHLPVGF